jgi:hypothetical protein
VEETTAGGKTRTTLVSFAPEFPAGVCARCGKNTSWTAKERRPGAQWSAAGKALRRAARETKRGAASPLDSVRPQATVSLFRKTSPHSAHGSTERPTYGSNGTAEARGSRPSCGDCSA